VTLFRACKPMAVVADQHFDTLDELRAIPEVKAEIENNIQPYGPEEVAEYEEQLLRREDLGLINDEAEPWKRRAEGLFVKLVLWHLLVGPIDLYFLAVVRDQPDGELFQYPIAVVDNEVEGLEVEPFRKGMIP